MAVTAYQKAIDYLSRREHCHFELKRKLRTKAIFTEAEIDQALAQCEEQGFLSDDRYIQSMVRYRYGIGYGPLRIKQQLKAMHLSVEEIDHAIAQHDWSSALHRLYLKKFNGVKPADVRQRQKQMRFLLYRGFDVHQIQLILNG